MYSGDFNLPVMYAENLPTHTPQLNFILLAWKKFLTFGLFPFSALGGGLSNTINLQAFSVSSRSF